MKKIQTVIVTGLSGAGKTKTVEWFEDNGYYCVDNMPPSLIENFITLVRDSKSSVTKAAFSVDIRGGEFFKDFKETIERLKFSEDIDCKILFIEASTRELVKRYSETRRKHPLAKGPVSGEVVRNERTLLREIRNMSDYIIDTTSMKPAELKSEIGSIVIGENRDSMFTINVISFGFKHGIPIDTDLIFDMRFVPNPFYEPDLKRLTGRDREVYDYVMSQPIAEEFARQIPELVEGLIPGYMKEGKYHLNVSFGCTGGQHRSVAMAERFFKEMNRKGYRVTIDHRDL